MVTGKMRLAMLSMVLFSALPVWAVSKDDFIAFIKARDSSIASYDVQIRKGHLNIALEDYDDFAEAIGQLEHMQNGDMNLAQMIDNVTGKWGKGITWVEIHMLKQGEQFKEITSSRQGAKVKTTVYDGQLYRDYSKHNEQLDIYADIPPIVHLNFENLGITMNRLTDDGDVISYTESEGGPQCTFSSAKDNSRITIQKYDSEFNIRKSSYHRDGKLRNDSRSLLYKKVEGYSIPELYVQMHLFKDRCSVYFYVIEDVKINCELTDKDFEIGEMPPWTVLIDHRQEPPTVTQLIDYPHEILSDEVMLDDLDKPGATPSQPTNNEPQIEVISPESNNTEQTPVNTEDEQSTETDSDAGLDSKIADSHTGYQWTVVLVLFLVVAVAGFAVAIGRKRK